MSVFKSDPHEFVITMGKTLPTDVELFFGPVIPSQDRIIYKHYDVPVKFDQILVDFGFFTSKGEVRRNNWTHGIPEGYSEIHRKHSHFYILKLTDDLL